MAKETRYEATSAEKCCLIGRHDRHGAYGWSSCSVPGNIGKGQVALGGTYFRYNGMIHEERDLNADYWCSIKVRDLSRKTATGN